MKANQPKFSVPEFSAQKELARIRNTFSFRFGLLVTESFVRKPWLMPLFPFRLIGLFFARPALQQIDYKNNSGPETYILFSTSEEGLSSVERSLNRGRELESQGFKVIHITSSRLSNQILEGCTHYALPDPKNKSAVESISEWNEICLNFLHQVVMTNNVTTLEFDGPYPYRGILNMLKIHPHIKSVWRRLATKIPPNKSHIQLFDEMDIIEIVFNDFSKPKKPVVFGNEEPKSIFMGVGYDSREGVGKGKTNVIRQLKQNANHQVIIYDHLQISNSALSPLPVERWNSTENKLLSENLQFAIVPPDPRLLQPLSIRGIPTLIICDDAVPIEIISSLRKQSLTQPISILHNPDSEEINVSMQPFIQERLNPQKYIH